MAATIEVLRRAAQPTIEAIDRLIASCSRSLKPVLAEIRDHFYDPGYTAKDLQAAVGMSNWLYEKFRGEVGLTPWKFIQECRMELALRLLRDTSLYVKDVASFVGYEEFPPLERLCRRWCRLTPARLRDHLRDRRELLRTLPEDVFSYRYYRRAVSGDLDSAEARRMMRYLESKNRL